MTSFAFLDLVGNIERLDPFVSSFVIPRIVDVWTPPQYEKDKDQKFAVLYMHDGQNLFDPSTSKMSHVDWGIDETITQLMCESKIRPTIVVGVWSTEKRMLEYMPQKLPHTLAFHQMVFQMKRQEKGELNSDNYLKFMVEELKPYIDAHFRTLPDVSNTFIMGSSMGGLISLYALCEYPQVFFGAGCVSTHFPIGRGITLKYLQDHLPDPETHKFYFDYGTKTLDRTYETYQNKADKILKDNGFIINENWITRKFEGHIHSETDWRKRVHIPLEFLLKE
jgi:predicted alpha/beta superfamily hydrolase